jgi:hypothetical protein
VKLLLIGLVIGVIVYVAMSGHVIFLPLIFLLPLGWIFRGGKREAFAQALPHWS